MVEFNEVLPSHPTSAAQLPDAIGETEGVKVELRFPNGPSKKTSLVSFPKI